ncbi:MAG: hypothetical protein ACM3SV_00385, partial [Betaproteobacteria bacterium]
PVTANGQIELIKQANPYITNGETSWLSIDLRVFQVKAGEGRFGVTMGGSPGDAPGFIQSVMGALTAGGGSAGGQSFETDLSLDEDTSVLSLMPQDGDGNAVFNFALARVRMRGLTLDAQNTRVFFRLFEAQHTNVAFDQGTTYRRFSDGTPGGHAIPLAGILGGEYVTLPCFATPRVDTTATSMTAQFDAPNVQTIVHNPTGAEVDTFFGCWLDTNQPGQKVLPETPPGGNPDGPFGGTLLSVEEVIVRNPHQCLVAEIAFDPVAIPNNADPSTSDKLAQRNLAFGPAPNPGVEASRRVPQTFALKPTVPAILAAGLPPDELMIDWGNTPVGSTAQIYLPAVKADAVLDLARRMYAIQQLKRVDEHTLECQVEGTTYVPIPGAPGVEFAGLFTVDLPLGIKKGQRFDIVVRQVTSASGTVAPPPPPPPGIALERTITRPRPQSMASTGGDLIHWRRVMGAFQIAIPVSTKAHLLGREESLLSILRWIDKAIPLHSRWYPVFKRYLHQIAGRVDGFGGDSGSVPPTPGGVWHHHPRPCDEPCDKPPCHEHEPPCEEPPCEEPPCHEHEPCHEPCHEPPCHESRSIVTGKVAGIAYDHFGDFAGFVIESDTGCEHCFHSREDEIKTLVTTAWETRARLSVTSTADRRAIPTAILILGDGCHETRRKR